MIQTSSITIDVGSKFQGMSKLLLSKSSYSDTKLCTMRDVYEKAQEEFHFGFISERFLLFTGEVHIMVRPCESEYDQSYFEQNYKKWYK